MTVKFDWRKANRRTAAITWRARQPDPLAGADFPVTPKAAGFRVDSAVTQADLDLALHQAVSCLNCTDAEEALGLRANVHSMVNGITLRERMEVRKNGMKPREGRFDAARDREEAALAKMVRILERHGAKL